jgi:hypothetical protein
MIWNQIKLISSFIQFAGGCNVTVAFFRRWTSTIPDGWIIVCSWSFKQLASVGLTRKTKRNVFRFGNSLA